MVTLPQLDHYTPSELEEACRFSPVLKTYLNHLSRHPQNFSDQLRQDKHKHWILCSLATIFKKDSAENICLYWSIQTEKILKQAWSEAGLEASPISLLAFGKLGSRELNLSSDIDVVFVRDNESDANHWNAKIKTFIRLLSETTSFGFAYRVDLNLRPGGDMSPLLPSKAHFYNFFDEYLEAWHRLSFIRMRPLLGPKQLNNDLEGYCQRRAFPRRLDFSVIEEIKNIRKKIQYQWRKENEPLNIKLHPGGIRDIELLVHSLQVIYGGRRAHLQTHSFSKAIEELLLMKAITETDKEFLYTFYWHLRTIENWIHCKNDQHTYLYNADHFNDLQKKKLRLDGLESELNQAHKIINQYFEASNEEPKAANPEKLSDSSQKAIDDIKGLKSHSLKKSTIEAKKNEILDSYIAIVRKIAVDEDLAIQTFRDFIFAIKSKSSIFFLLSRHPKLLENLAWLFSISPLVGQTLCRRPELVDSFALGQVMVNPEDDTETLLINLLDYKLLGQLFAIINLFKKRDITGYCRLLSEQADFICSRLIEHLGQQEGMKPISMLCLGKWSGFEMGIQSDLDFVFVTDGPPSTEQIKCARRVISLLTTHSSVGKLYNIDLRLKPNENAGPLLLEKQKFLEYVNEHALAWQKQAWLRSRLLGEERPYFSNKLNLLQLSQSEAEEIDEIRKKLLTSADNDKINIKSVEGGLIDTEFRIQKLFLTSTHNFETTATGDLAKKLSAPDELVSKIIENYQFLRLFEQILQICNASPSTKVSRTSSTLSRVARLIEHEDPFGKLLQVITEQRHLLNSLDASH